MLRFVEVAQAELPHMDRNDLARIAGAFAGMATEAQTRALASEASTDERLLTAKQAALLTGLHPETIRERGRRGLLPKVNVGKSVRFRKNDLLRGERR
jgi:excisionase family DNA binding protein